MDQAAVTEFPFVEALPKREKSKLAKLWDHFQEIRQATATYGTLLPQYYAAELLGVSRQRVHTLVEGGRLETVLVGGRRFVTESSMMKFAKSERAIGRNLTLPSVGETWKSAVSAAREVVKNS